MTRFNLINGVDNPPRALRVLLADNEINSRNALETNLRIAGFEVAAADDGEEALRLALHVGFDIIIARLDIPVKNGLMVCEELRASQVQTPLVMLSAEDEVEDRLKALDAGADDYLTEPFDVLELIARIRVIVRRTIAPPCSVFTQIHEFGDLRVDATSSTAWLGNERLRLSMMEYALLLYLVRHPGEVLGRRRILDEVWHSDPSIGPRIVDVHIAWLRKKIGSDSEGSRWIRTVHGEGYLFVSG